MKFVKKDGRTRPRWASNSRYFRQPVGRPGKGQQLQEHSGDPDFVGHLAGARVGSAGDTAVESTGATGAIAAIGALLLGLAVLSSACTTAAPLHVRLGEASVSTTDPVSTIDAAVVGAWRSAEQTFFAAEAQTLGYSSPQLDAEFAEPELSTIKRNLALQSFQGEVGEGSSDLGRPVVVSLGPTESDPTLATVVSCIHDTQVLVYRATGEPVPGVLGVQDWAAVTSEMVLDSAGTWKISSQRSAIDKERSAACAGLGS